MDIISSLRESNLRLIKLENILYRERDALINHKANDIRTLTDNAMHFNYMQMIEKYTGYTDDYNKELMIFKDLLKRSVNQQSLVMKSSSNHNIVHLNDNNEITSNYLPTSISSLYNDSNASTNSVEREIASSNINIDLGPVPVPNEEILQLPLLPKIQPKPQPQLQPQPQPQPEPESKSQPQSQPMRIDNRKRKPIRVKVSNKLAYKYEGLGFDIWRKNGRRAMYTMTELKVNKSFSNDQGGKLKLKKFLIKSGFKANTIEKVQVIKKKENRYGYGLIQVRDSPDNVENVLDKVNNGKDEALIEYIYQRQYGSRRNQNCKLFVKNFDIIDKKDHKRMTDMFLRFGDLECDIFMNRDRNGNPYCFVTYRDIFDAIACEKNQNWRSQRNINRDPLWFNGRELNIQYSDDSKKGNNGRKKKKNSSKKYYNTRR